MYAIAILRYRQPVERVIEVTEEHRSYLRDLANRGILLVSGAMDPRTGGMLLLRVPDGPGALAALDAIRDGDPFVSHRIAQYELLPWLPSIGKDKLDQL